MEKHPITEYLYKLEKSIYQPSTSWTSTTHLKTIRLTVLDWLSDVINKFKFSIDVLFLTMRIMDDYTSLIIIDKENAQIISCASLCLAVSVITTSAISVNDIIYISDNAFSAKSFFATQNDIMLKLNGIIIRPFPYLFFSDKDKYHISLAYICLWDDTLMTIRPSIIAETINYLLTGKYLTDLYTWYDISNICSVINKIINRAYTSDYMKVEISKVKNNLELNCKERLTNKIYLPIKTPTKDYIVLQPFSKSFKKFNKSDILGTGVTGNVFKIEKNNNYFAVKLNANLYCEEVSILQLLATAKNADQNIVKLSGFLPDKLYSAYMFFEVGDFNLSEAVSKKLLPFQTENQLLSYIQNILIGLQLCNEYDVIHGDIKPLNIVWFAKSKTFKLIDFGLSQAMTSYKSNLIPEVGTIGYRAPEVILDNGKYDYKVDIWAFGCSLYYMITGKEMLTMENGLAHVKIVNGKFTIDKDPFKADKSPIKMNDYLLLRSDLNSLTLIFELFGTPSETNWPGLKSLGNWDNYKLIPTYPKTEFLDNKIPLDKNKCFAIIKKCFTLNPSQRPSAHNLLKCMENL